MGEAKRRRELQERTRPMPGDLRDDIANAARAVTMVPTEGGYCVAINQLGYVVLRSCGLEPVMAMGSLIYRVGLDPVRDVVCFSGPGGAGCMHGSTLLGHLWLEMDGDIIDFSSGDWKMTTTALCAYGPEPKLPLRYARLHALIDGYFWHSGPKNMDQLFGLGPNYADSGGLDDTVLHEEKALGAVRFRSRTSGIRLAIGSSTEGGMEAWR